jgi:hypothetical protein
LAKNAVLLQPSHGLRGFGFWNANEARDIGGVVNIHRNTWQV